MLPTSSCTSPTSRAADGVALPSETLLRRSRLDHISQGSAPAVDAAATHNIIRVYSKPVSRSVTAKAESESIILKQLIETQVLKSGSEKVKLLI